MESYTKKRLIILITFVLIMIIFVILVLIDINQKDQFNNMENSDAVDVNGNSILLNENLTEEVSTQHYKLSHLKMILDLQGNTQVQFDITNITQDVLLGRMLTITFLDQNKNELTTAKVFVSSLSKGATQTMTTLVEGDMTKSYTIDIKND